MKSLDFYKNLIIKNLDTEIQKFVKRNENLYIPIKYALEGGKKLRPAIVLKSTEIFGENYQKALSTALAIEIFHNFTLVHDDIMDNSDLRRNRQTVRAKWNDNQALLSGDAMLIITYEYLLDSLPYPIAQKILQEFNDTALKVCEGQQMDMDFEDKKTVSTQDYLKMIELKTAVLFASAFKIGGIIAQTSQDNLQNIYDYAINLGLSFQIQDDFLDLYGDEKIFGKKIGSDILNNKKTFLFISAVQNATSEEKEDLINTFYDKKISAQDKVSKIKNIYDRLQIKEKVKDEILKYFNYSVEYAEKLQIKDEDKEFLINFAKSLIQREY